MGRTALFSFYLIMILGSIYLGMGRFYEKSLQQFESLHLAYTIDLCSDAAAFKMMDTDNINADYADMDSVQVNPQVAKDTFVDVFCFNYGMMPNAENRSLIQNKYIPNLTVAGYDGFWMAQPACYEDSNIKTSYGLVFTPKLPYKAELKKDGRTTYYALNMGSQSAIKLPSNEKSSGSFVKTPISKLTSNKPGKDLSDYNVRQAVINKDLTDAIGASVATNIDPKKWKNTFFLPGNLTTYTDVNPVSGPSILALVENVDLLTGKKASAFSITGAKITTARPVVGYMKKDTKTGKQRKFYCYADKLMNKKGQPLYPFLQMDKETQRYLWWEFPQYKYLACSDKVDINKLRSDPNYKPPGIDTTKTTAINEATIITGNANIEATVQKIYNSKKEAAKDGYAYDNLVMRAK